MLLPLTPILNWSDPERLTQYDGADQTVRGDHPHLQFLTFPELPPVDCERRLLQPYGHRPPGPTLVGADVDREVGSRAAFARQDVACTGCSSPAGLSRAADFHVYLDEFHTFATLSLATMLSELRKYRVELTLAHQYLSQLEEEVRDAILGNVGTVISFRVGAGDASVLEQEFFPEFTAADLAGLPNYNIYLRLMVNGEVSRPFSAETLPPELPKRLA